MLSFAGYASASKSLALIAIVLLFTSAPRADAQQTPPRLLIDDAPACPSCRILTRTLVTLGAESGDAALIGPPGQVRMGHRGEYWVVESVSLQRFSTATALSRGGSDARAVVLVNILARLTC